jgi:predicted Co/Zn/Cd cation transporter (cation efflux family)
VKDHLLLMTVYSLGVSVFFGTLWRDTPRGRFRYGAVIFASLVGGSVAVAWLMTLLAPGS